MRRRLLHLVLQLVLPLAVGACTDPESVGPKPEYIGIGTDRNAALALNQSSRLPTDSCLPFAPLADVSARQGILGSSATIGFPAGMKVEARTFDGDRGSLFMVAGVGGIAVTRAPEFPLFFTPAVTGTRTPFDVVLLRWCRVVLDGRQATLSVSTFDVLRDQGASIRQVFRNDVVITATNPEGRTLYIRVFGLPPLQLVFEREKLPILPLLSVVASLRW